MFLSCEIDSGDEVVINVPVSQSGRRRRGRKGKEEKEPKEKKQLPLGIVLGADAEQLARLQLCNECGASGSSSDFLYAELLLFYIVEVFFLMTWRDVGIAWTVASRVIGSA